MLAYLKNLFQLILSPSRGWEDISASMHPSRLLLHEGFYPLLTVASLSEFLRLFYDADTSFVTLLELAIAMGGTYFASYFIAGMVLESYLKNMVDGEINRLKVDTFVIYGLSLLLVIELITSVVPTDLTLIKFLPLFVALILYKGSAYMSVKSNCELRFLCLSVIAVIVVPIGFFTILKLIFV